MSQASTYASPPPPAEPQFSAELTAQTIVAAFRMLPYSVMSDTLAALEDITAQRFKQLTANYESKNTRPQPPLAHEGDERRRCQAEEAAARQPLCHRCGKTKPEHPWKLTTTEDHGETVIRDVRECAAFVSKPITRIAPIKELLKPHPHIGRSSRKA